MASKPADLVISSLLGGMNNSDPPHFLPDDQCVEAINVEFFDSTLGERRRGCEAIDIEGSELDNETAVTGLIAHTTTAQTSQIGPSLPQELWAHAISIQSSTTIARRDETGVWEVIDPLDEPDPEFHLRMNMASFHGKLWIAYKSAVDRVHLWDGDDFRRASIEAPTAAPVVTDSPGAGTFTHDRLYRVRIGEVSFSPDLEILRVSEPSEETTFTPDGAHDGAVIELPAFDADENPNGWAIEASSGDGNWYVIGVEAIGTTEFTDTTADPADYPDVLGILSPDIGDYSVVPSVQFIKVDQDRLIFASLWEDPEGGSRILWTPVFGDPGYMNDERIPIDTNNFIDLDWEVGGSLTGLSDPVDGSFYAFKLSRIYKVQRTGLIDQAYEAFLLTSERGALYGSIVNGLDEFGRGCVYFLDPAVGPCRIGAGGLQTIRGLGGTWRTINAGADHIISHGVHYPDKQQLHWWVCQEHAESPNLKLVLQISQIKSDDDGTSRGWSLADGRIAGAWCSAIVPEIIIDANGTRHLTHTPYIGGRSFIGYIARCDTGDDDNGTEYTASIVTKPYMLAGLNNRWQGMAAALLAAPLDDDTVEMDISFTKDYGKETNTVTTNFVPDSTESAVIKKFDNLRMAEATSIQFEFRDAS